MSLMGRKMPLREWTESVALKSSDPFRDLTKDCQNLAFFEGDSLRLIISKCSLKDMVLVCFYLVLCRFGLVLFDRSSLSGGISESNSATEAVQH